ncbi:reticulon-like protein b13 [Phtheirospermum japonicum]|uniref:Reticulon-like protein n=1 Tax=Phtheirospermum japonicum TaxID=374723 RepID=A0A830D3D3_9LAMI|nr:reticulon-like protein b13 [Phtheirospermum japonicum]
MSDVVLWRRKQLNLIILLVATATWVVMELYQYSFITLFSWVAMAIVACLFFWGNIHRLLKKEAPDLSELEISEETAMEHANSFRQWAQEGIRLVFHVSAEREWFVFAAVVAFLYVMSVVASHLHFVTLLYLGVVGVMTIPAIYMKNENKFAEFGEKVRMRSQRLYSMIKQRFQEMKSKIGRQHKEIKEKKLE